MTSADFDSDEGMEGSTQTFIALTSPSISTSHTTSPLVSPVSSNTFTLASLPVKESNWSSSHCIRVRPLKASPDAAAAPATPCPGQQYYGTWRFPSLLYFGWMTPLIRLGAKRPLEFTDLWQTFDSDKADTIWSRFEPAWRAQREKAARQGRRPKLLNTFCRVYGWEFLWCCLTYAWVCADALLGPQFLKQLVSYSVEKANDSSLSSWEGYKW